MTDKLDEMWAALAAYQDKADARGHGESWALMCSDRTKDAVKAAAKDDYYDGYRLEPTTAAKAAYAAAYGAAHAAIYHINKAQGEAE
jgi:hypothetical protein